MIDNQHVAILTKLNELAERFGIKPNQFVATVHADPESGSQTLCFEVPAQGNALREERFGKMLESLGVNADGFLPGGTERIIDALDDALQRAPRRRF